MCQCERESVRERGLHASACVQTTSINKSFLAAGFSAPAEWITDSVIRTFAARPHHPPKLLSAHQDNVSTAWGGEEQERGGWRSEKIFDKKKGMITYSISRAKPNTLSETECFSNLMLFTIDHIIKKMRKTKQKQAGQFSFRDISLKVAKRLRGCGCMQ